MNLGWVIRFCEEEVVRQGFVRGTTAWERRVYYMLRGWALAQEESDAGRKPTPAILMRLGHLVDEDANPRSDAFRNCGVTVAGRRCPPSNEVPGLIEALCLKEPELTPDEFYLEFERIHPFADGNGRTGKILHNWLLGTLDDPVLVKDYFGGGIP